MSLRVVPSSKGLPSKRCPGVRFLSRVNREFGIFQHSLQSQQPPPSDEGLLLISLFGEEKKSPYRLSALPFCSSSFLSLSPLASLFLCTFSLPTCSWKSHPVLALFSRGVEGWYPTPLPSHTAQFTSPYPQPCQLGRVLKAHRGSGSTGGRGGGASAVRGCALRVRSQNVP